MSKIYLGIIAALAVILSLGFWRYSAVLQDMGELEQSNHQLQAALEAAEKQNQSLLEQQKNAMDISASHHEKTLAILRTEQQSQRELLQHKINKLQQHLQQSTVEKAAPVQTIKTADKEINNEKKKEECAETAIPEFYLKQL